MFCRVVLALSPQPAARVAHGALEGSSARRAAAVAAGGRQRGNKLGDADGRGGQGTSMAKFHGTVLLKKHRVSWLFASAPVAAGGFARMRSTCLLGWEGGGRGVSRSSLLGFSFGSVAAPVRPLGPFPLSRALLGSALAAAAVARGVPVGLAAVMLQDARAAVLGSVRVPCAARDGCGV